jgi:tetratricopeptide (TPR) repeat protein
MSDTDLTADAPEVDDEANERTELLREGDEKYEADEFEAAIDCYDRAIELDPEDASGYYKRGEHTVRSHSISKSSASTSRHRQPSSRRSRTSREPSS